VKEILFNNDALKQYNYWKKTNNIKIVNKIKKLIIDIQEHPFTGIGKPEALKNNYSGLWSRRINNEHRLVYSIENDAIIIVQCRFHY
jgi:toxin YoeB